MQAIRFHYRPARYLVTRRAARRRPSLALGRLGCVALDDVEPPALPGPDWVRVETALSGICGSDLAVVTARSSFMLEPFSAYPFTFGHENVGRIVETGDDVAGWTVGERVVVNPMLACRQRGLDPLCPPCASGEYGCCRHTDAGVIGGGFSIGYCPAVGGGWSRYFVAHVSQLHGAGGLTDEVAVLADPFATAVRAVLLHPPRHPPDVALVIGAGNVGLLTVAALRAIGWQGPVAVLDPIPLQLERAEAAGADHVFSRRDELYRWAASLPTARSYKPTLAPRFVEGGPSLVYDTVGSRGSLRDALALAREAGRIVMIGTVAGADADWTRLWYRRLTLAGVLVYGHVPWRGEQRDVFDVTLELLPRAGLERIGMVTHTFPLAEYRPALAAALDKKDSGAVKVVFRPEG